MYFHFLFLFSERQIEHLFNDRTGYLMRCCYLSILLESVKKDASLVNIKQGYTFCQVLYSMNSLLFRFSEKCCWRSEFPILEFKYI